MDLLTADEKTRLEQRVRDLIANRAVLSERIEEARALGDLKENAEYHAAREQQGLDEAEIRRLEERLATAQVVDTDRQAEGVVFLGSTVKMREVETDDVDLYRLVGEASETPPMDYFEVTVASPMGEAMLKSRLGETIRVDTPRGEKHFEILEIE
ncbi:MAG: transcription elongation factor GreA [Planctomycetota bacterium]